jgi:hypothetical protein
MSFLQNKGEEFCKIQYFCLPDVSCSLFFGRISAYNENLSGSDGFFMRKYFEDFLSSFAVALLRRMDRKTTFFILQNSLKKNNGGNNMQVLIMYYSRTGNTKKFQMEDKIGAAFATSAHHTGGKETTIISIIEAFLIYGMIVVGDPLDASGHYGVACTGTPDERTAQDAAKMGKRVASLVKKLKG